MKKLPAVIIFGLDPSEDIVGFTASYYKTGAAPQFLFGHKIEAGKHGGEGDSDTCLFRRALYVKEQLTRLFRECYPSLDTDILPVTHTPLLAFESPQAVQAAWGLRASTTAVHNAVGAYVSLKCFAPFDKYRVGTMDAAALYAGRGEKTPKKKMLAIAWANEFFKESLPAPLTKKDDAIADALAPAEIAWRRWSNEQLLLRAKAS